LVSVWIISAPPLHPFPVLGANLLAVGYAIHPLLLAPTVFKVSTTLGGVRAIAALRVPPIGASLL
jgi:hypothetical protein